MYLPQFLADRTEYGRAYATVLRLSLSVCRLLSVTYTVRIEAKQKVTIDRKSYMRYRLVPK